MTVRVLCLRLRVGIRRLRLGLRLGTIPTFSAPAPSLPSLPAQVMFLPQGHTYMLPLLQVQYMVGQV
jgi:hypothetical protein